MRLEIKKSFRIALFFQVKSFKNPNWLILFAGCGMRFQIHQKIEPGYFGFSEQT